MRSLCIMYECMMLFGATALQRDRCSIHTYTHKTMVNRPKKLICRSNMQQLHHRSSVVLGYLKKANSFLFLLLFCFFLVIKTTRIYFATAFNWSIENLGDRDWEGHLIQTVLDFILIHVCFP